MVSEVQHAEREEPASRCEEEGLVCDWQPDKSKPPYNVSCRRCGKRGTQVAVHSVSEIFGSLT